MTTLSRHAGTNLVYNEFSFHIVSIQNKNIKIKIKYLQSAILIEKIANIAIFNGKKIV